MRQTDYDAQNQRAIRLQGKAERAEARCLEADEVIDRALLSIEFALDPYKAPEQVQVQLEAARRIVHRYLSPDATSGEGTDG